MEINKEANETEKVWKTSVEETIIIFRDALLALIPVMDRAHIPYKEGEQYDDYDAIANALYEQIVVGSIQWSFTDSDSIQIPPYGFPFDPKRHTAVVEVCTNSEVNDNKFYIFHSFDSKDVLFDSVFCKQINTDFENLSEETQYFSLEQCSFRLAYKDNNDFAVKTSLTVLL